MRDAESMLDQLLSTDAGPLSADRVRDVLGLVDEETVEAFLAALVRGDAIVGIDVLDGLEERGRDLRAFAEQAIERLRIALVASLGRGSPGGLAAAGPEALGAAARRLASIDPLHQGPGGLRLQLELAFLVPPLAAAQPWPAFPPTIERAAVAPPPAAAQQPPPPDAASAPGRVAASAPSPAELPAPAQRPNAGSGAAQQSPAIEPAPPAAHAPARPALESRPPARPSRTAPQGSGRPEPAETPSPDVPVASAAPRTRTGPTLALLLERWAEVVEVVSKSPVTKPLIVACRPVSVDGAVVTLGFPEAQSFFKDVAERRKSILEDGVSRVLGIPVTVRCVAANVEVSPLPEDPDGTRLLTEFKRIYGDDVVDVGDVG
jgi:hypothetical protein